LCSWFAGEDVLAGRQLADFVVLATAFESEANSSLPFSSSRGTVVSTFSNGIPDLYTHGVQPTSDESGETGRRLCALLTLLDRWYQIETVI
jgi:hypothetical protein